MDTPQMKGFIKDTALLTVRTLNKRTFEQIPISRNVLVDLQAGYDVVGFIPATYDVLVRTRGEEPQLYKLDSVTFALMLATAQVEAQHGSIVGDEPYKLIEKLKNEISQQVRRDYPRIFLS